MFPHRLAFPPLGMEEETVVTRTWPGPHNSRPHFRSCIELSRPPRPPRRFPSPVPFLDLAFLEDFPDLEEPPSMASNVSDSSGTLSEIFESLSRFTESSCPPREEEGRVSVDEIKPAVGSTSSTGTVSCLGWQERCVELEEALQRFGEQAGRVRGLLTEKLAELEQRVVEAERRADEAEEKVRVMEQEVSGPSGNGVSWDIEEAERLARLQNTVREKERVISRLECQVEEQRLLRLQESRQVEEKAAKIKDWVSNKLRDLEEQNELLREQNTKCESQLELLRSRLSQLNSIQWKGKERHSTEDSSRGSYEGDRVPSDESPPPDVPESANSQSQRPISATAACLAAIRRRSGAFDNAEERNRRRKSNLSSGSPSGTGSFGTQERISRESRSSRVDSGSVDMETPQSLSPRSPLDSLEGPIPHMKDENVHSPVLHQLPAPVPVTVPTPLAISSPPSPAAPADILSPRIPRPPIVPPRRTRTRSPTPNTSKGTTPGSPPTEEEDASVLRARLDAECQQLARDLQAAVRELVRPELVLRGRAADEVHDYSEIYTPSAEKAAPLCLPPPPPIHRFPSWESRIYEVAAGGLKVGKEGGENSQRQRPFHSLAINFSVPVYTTVKGRASQIRSAPFSGDSTDSSDGEEALGSSSHPLSSDLSSPGKSGQSSLNNSLSPLHRSSSSPSKTSLRRDPSFESEMSDDYAIPPDAFASETNSLDMALSAGCHSIPLQESSPRKESLEKSGFLTKLGGKLKTWRKRWFVLRNGVLTYWKSQHDASRRPPAGREIPLDENCRVTRGDGAATFEIATPNKTYYLSADTMGAVDEWVRVLQNVVRRNATKLVLSMEDSKPTVQGWLVKVKNGHAKRCWCVLIGKMFLSFKGPSDIVISGQVNMRDVRVEDVEHVSDSESEEKTEPVGGSDALTVALFPTHQSPIYLHFPSKPEKDTWLYHLTVVSGKGPSAGTPFEQLVHKLMEVDGDPNSSLWKNPLLLHSKESITSPLTSLSSEALQAEAIKLFKSCQLFMSVPLDSAGIDYHVALAQNALQLALDFPELQQELLCALVKQTSKLLSFKSSTPTVGRTLNKIKHSRFLLNATQSLFLCDSSSNHGKIQPIQSGARGPQGDSRSSSPSRSLRSGSPSKGKAKGSSSVPSSPLLSSNHRHYGLGPTEGKSGVRSFTFVQGWQLLALAVSLFLPKNSKLLWILKQHLTRNVDTKSETGKYAAYCQRSIERTLANGPRIFRPSRMEVLSILMKNPFHHSLPHSVPVHFLNGAYQVVGFDGSTTVEEFLYALCHDIGCRDPVTSGFALSEDDPFEKDLEHSLKFDDKICDVISQWENVLREKGSGKFETRRAVRLTFKSRIYRRSAVLQETDKERFLLCYQTNEAVVSGRFPLTRELALELAALMAQIDSGDYKGERGRGSGGQPTILQVMDKYYPTRYKDNLSREDLKLLNDGLIEKWTLLRGKSTLDCVRIYLTCTRKWPFFGATLFNVTVGGTYTIEDGSNVLAAICEDGIAILDCQTLQQIVKYSYSSVQTFGGALDDHFMVVVDDSTKKRRLLFGGISKHKVLEMTRLVADYINACCCQNSIFGPASALTRHNSLKSSRFQGSSTLPPPTPRMDRKLMGDGEGSHVALQRCDSLQTYRNPR